ncbi:MAG TPA: dihydroorotate dehydrogenase (quinone) [Dehalococcoidia bacterium]|jgi:dihydroorotate dehydrogenase|nr:dihydroorotate dehydrogenase (quinone) [Chloroflexota bacterium]MDP5876077.1 dihydroorotate dehydrogenase (quinone) [Dehalococcoidia bacterium]MDP6272825.1 dihydroorotate dehydrogenase (quinone) [Dehalococcoidia bacterium]MDP7160623.1 dihydroorotate dehydrogenase (quinone) [Dehalococcoidia bacterium]MDP7213669.1 dihydroorotate dehydrogenase (quinone) [Dehalococcoidia bacterium]|tara:strand:+ start:2543 stop:3568 length:1026 start_codon:yes stop_codon:yes gene_type:complete
MGLYSTLARPLLFRFPPETAHGFGDFALRISPLWSVLRPMLSARDQRLETTVASIKFPNPVGVAAGLDKDCRFLSGLLDIGFGFATGGTVTRDARPGNAQPRVVREPGQRALLNALGFPGEGLDAAESRLRGLSERRRSQIMVSISGTGVADIAECHRRLQPLVTGIEVNVSSPNTVGLRTFHQPENLERLVSALVAQRDRPLFVKLPSWRSDEERDEMMPMAQTSLDAGADGLVVANTHPVVDDRLAVGRGGFSGAPILDDTVRMVADARGEMGNNFGLIACGGVGTADQVWRLMEAGASAVQLYTSFIYEGPGLPGRINRDLVERMDVDGVSGLPGVGG